MEERLLLGGIISLSADMAKARAELVPRLDVLNQELSQTKAQIQTAGKLVSDVADARAQQIAGVLQELTAALRQAGDQFQQASEQSTRLGRQMNRLTLALVFAAVITAVATGFYAWETKRQVELMRQQLQTSAQHPNNATQNH